MNDKIFNEQRRKFLSTSAVVVSGVAMGGSMLVPSFASAKAATSLPRATTTVPTVIGYTNEKGLLIERVTYPNRNTQTSIVANLFKPAGFDQNKKYAAIVVTHPIGGVKEQTAGLYAQKLAEQGFITLAYDASYQGESGGEPHLMELPSARVDDISCSIDFLSTLSYVDANRIGSLGICGGGGYVLSAAQTEQRIKAVATVSAAEIGDLRRNGLSNSRTYEQRMQLLKDAAEQRTREARGEAIRLTPTVPESTKDFTESTPVMYREGYEYYRTARGQHPNAPARAVFSSLPSQMAFYAFEQLETISPRPALMIAGAKADSLYFSELAYQKTQEPKELFLVPGASHIDMYDKPQYVTPAVTKLTAFYQQYLA
ncbi:MULTISPECIES: alpha/beta hydrolase [Pectobacterium]|uniref:alpha/beta hydrolase n=1 Tax=Pectobacterium TaxID=122277 RepID=UPI00057FC000|nr:alpha/beta hydrolase [Pectobacterium carotovorum]KHT33336.1 DeoR faimly transcriptional regulator [Pectobacterium carotovorum subsp. carotovorum]